MKRSPLKRLTPPRRSKRLNPISKKQREVIRQRAEARMTDPPLRCEFPQGCEKPVADWHERLPRSQGGSATHPANRVYLCRWHHEWVHSYPKAAHALGLRRWSWEGESD